MRWVPFLVPNLFTAANVGLGWAAIILAREGRFELATWMIVYAVLFDKADGTAARLLKGSTRFGREFDSMADLIAFGLAPALVVYQAGRASWASQLGSGAFWVLLMSCGFYAMMAAVRLARFNAVESVPGQRHFVGVASTICGGIGPVGLLVAVRHGVSPEWLRLYPLVMVVLGLGMVSRLPVPKIMLRRKRVYNIVQLVLGLAIYVCGFAMVLPEVLLAITLGYLAIGITLGLLHPPEPPPTPAVPSPGP